MQGVCHSHSMAGRMRTDYDIVIAGAGMVGLTVSCLLCEGLQDHSLRLAVLEAHPSARFTPAEDIDLRVSAVSRASQAVLRAAGAWPAIASARISPYRDMRVWSHQGRWDDAHALHFDCADIGEPDLGHIIENRLIQDALLRRLERVAAVDIASPARVTGLNACDGQIALQLSGRRKLTARLLIAADGADSRCRALMEIPTIGWSYGQRAVVTHARFEHPHGQTAFQRFLPDGPLALLPLSDGRCSIVWSTSEDNAFRLEELESTTFDKELSSATDRVLGAVVSSRRRASFPLRLLHARRYTAPRFALVGDSAHAVHPLAGQGANMGFIDAAALVQVLLDGLDQGHDPGDEIVLRRYERWRKGENLVVIAALDGLKRLFGSKPLQTLARPALSIINRSAAAKNLLIRRAMGLEGDLPRAARSRPLQSETGPAV